MAFSTKGEYQGRLNYFAAGKYRDAEAGKESVWRPSALSSGRKAEDEVLRQSHGRRRKMNHIILVYKSAYTRARTMNEGASSSDRHTYQGARIGNLDYHIPSYTPGSQRGLTGRKTGSRSPAVPQKQPLFCTLYDLTTQLKAQIQTPFIISIRKPLQRNTVLRHLMNHKIPKYRIFRNNVQIT